MSHPNPPPIPPRPVIQIRLSKPKRGLPVPEKPEFETLPSTKQNIHLPGLETVSLKLTPEQRNKRYFLQLEIINKGLDLMHKRKLKSFSELMELLQYEQTLNKIYTETITDLTTNSEDALAALELVKAESELTPVEELRIAECCATCKFFIPENHCWLSRPKPTWNTKGLKGKTRAAFVAANYPEVHAWAVCDGHRPSGDKKRLKKLFKKFNLER